MTIGLGIGLGITIGGNGGGGGPTIPTALYGPVSRESGKDGSPGTVFTLDVVGATGIQWYRMALASPYSVTKINGATSAVYTSTTNDIGYRLVAVYTESGTEKAAKTLQVVFAAPVMIDAMENLTSITGSATFRSLDTVRKVQGTNSVAVQSNGADSTNNATRTTSFSADPSTLGVIHYYLNAGTWLEETLMTNGQGMRFSSNGQPPQFDPDAGDAGPLANNILNGMWHSFDVSEYTEFTNDGAGAIRWHWQPSGHLTPYLDRTNIDAIMANSKGRPTIVLQFDDAVDNQMTAAVPIMDQYSIKGSFMVPWGNVGTAGRYTTSQILAAFANGHDFQLDGTSDDSIMNTRTDIATLTTELTAGIAYIQSLLGYAPRAICYPNGSFNRSTGNNFVSHLATSDGANPTHLIAGAGVTFDAGIVAGKRVIYANAPTGLTVAARNSDTDLTLSAQIPLRATETLTRFGIAQDEFSTERMQNMLSGLGIRSARTTNGGVFSDRFGWAGRGLILPGNTTTQLAWADILPTVQKAILRGSTAIFYIHGVTDSQASNLNMPIAVFTEIVQQLGALRDAGTIDILTQRQVDDRQYIAGVPL
jgi:peptidoglycan/xylan/chitin deacetylase (PgdA/CDA1 family)